MLERLEFGGWGVKTLERLAGKQVAVLSLGIDELGECRVWIRYGE